MLWFVFACCAHAAIGSDIRTDQQEKNIQKILKKAKAELGKPGTKYVNWYKTLPGKSSIKGDGPYGAMFVSWVFSSAGVTYKLLPSAYVPRIRDFAEEDGDDIVSIKKYARAGDLVIVDLSSGAGDDSADQIGIVTGNDGENIKYIAGVDNGVVSEISTLYSKIGTVIRPENNYFRSVKFGKVTDAIGANIRKLPSNTSEILGDGVRQDQEVALDGKVCGKWVHGKPTGWANIGKDNDYLKLTCPENHTPDLWGCVVEITTDDLNIRSEPSVDKEGYSVLMQANTGDKFASNGEKDSSGKWYRILYNTTLTGWMYHELVNVEISFGKVIAMENTEIRAEGQAIVVSRGTEMDLIDMDMNSLWMKVKYSGFEGYVDPNVVRIEPSYVK